MAAKGRSKPVAPPESYETVFVPAGALNPAPYNPRKATEKEVADVRESITTFGFVEPLVVNCFPGRENVVIGGHLRLRVALLMGMATVPVHYVSLDEKRERELNLRLNKNTGQWDWDILANEFEIDELRDVGFTDVEIGLGDTSGTDTDEEWSGMPEFDQKDKTAFRSIVVHFKDQASVDEFASLVGQAISEKARMIWHPIIEIERFADKRYGDDDET